MKPQPSFLVVLASALLASSASSATFTVTSAADAGPGTLRQAIMDANASPGADVIEWKYQGGEREIHLDSALPEITDSLSFDGTTQPGYVGPQGLAIYLPFGTDGLVIRATNCAVRGLWLVNCGGGIVLRDTARGAVIGGTNRADGNSLGFCAEAGVRVEGGSGHVIINNRLSQNYGAGALIVGGANCLITNNQITLNGGGGVIVTGGTNHTIRANFMVGNTGLGIDLAGDGVTLNDNDDPDGGPNFLQNFPVISSAAFSASGLTVSGTLNSRPSRTYTLDFYSNVASDDSGNGEAERHLGSALVTTAGSGNGNFNVTLTNAPVGRYVTATATDAAGNTSEFSPCVRFTSTFAPVTFTVTNVNDSGPGSLRQAILDSNARFANGVNTIAFNIPGTGVRRILLTSDVLPRISEPVILDGYTQPGSSVNTASNAFNGVVLIRVDGAVLGYGRAFDITAGNCAVRGLNIMSFRDAAAVFTGGSSNTVAGNLIGVSAEGEPGPVGWNNQAAVSFYASSNNLIGGTNLSARNVIAAVGPGGASGFGTILLDNSSSNRIAGNFLGSDTTGTNVLWGGGDGVRVQSYSMGNVIGGATAVARNVILGHYGSSVFVDSSCAGNIIQGNYLEVGADGLRFPDVLPVILLSVYVDGTDTLIGGPNAGEGNVIRGYVFLGIGEGNAILRNSLLAHESIGIDLGGDGPTPNDADDSDTGPNGLQNYPEILGATVYPNRTVLRSRLQSTPGATYRIDFYESDRLPPSGYAEAKTWLGTTNVALGGSGQATFNWSPATTLAPGHWVTATATDPANNTSELSPPSVVALSNAVNLVVSLTLPVEPVSRTSNFTCTVEVRNLGPTNATGIVLTNLLSTNLTFVSAIPSQGTCAHAAGVVTCSLGTLTSGGLATVVLTVHPESNGPVSLTARAFATQAEAYAADNVATGGPYAGIADVDVVAGSFVPSPVIAGQQFDTLVTITNLGPDPSFVSVYVLWTPPDVPVSITTPLGTVPVFAAGASADVGLLPAGGSALISARTLNPWAANNVSGGISVRVSGDGFDPDYDYFTGNAPVAPGPGVFTFENATQSVGESESFAGLRVLRYGGALGSVTIDYVASAGTATPGVDYTAVSGTLFFGSGQTESCIYVPVLDDFTAEWGESFTLSLSNPTGGATLLYNGNSNCVVRILDNDPSLRGVVAGASVLATNPSAAGFWPSARASLSEDGRYVAIEGSADLVTGDPAIHSDMFVRDLVAGTTVLASVSRFGTNGVNNGGTADAHLSADGQRLVFVSQADNLVTNENPAAYTQVYLRDLTAGVTRLVSVTASGGLASGYYTQNPSITSNGQAVAFMHDAPDLSPIWDGNNVWDVFFRDEVSGVTHLVSVNRWGTATGNGASHLPFPFSYPGYRLHGRYVGFHSDASDLVAGDNNGVPDVFVRDLTNGVTTLVSINRFGTGSGNGTSFDPLLSFNGRYALFRSDASDLVANDTNETEDVFLRDLVAGTTRLVSVNRFGTGSGNGASWHLGFSRDGRFALFESHASDVVPNDNNGQSDVFVRDLLTDSTLLVSVNCDGTGAADGWSTFSSISPDGRYVAFVSSAPDVVRGAGGPGHAYLRDLVAGTTTLLSANWRGGVSPSGACEWTAVADGAAAVAFISRAGDLLPIDGNGGQDVFVWRPVSSNTVDLVMEQVDSPGSVWPGANVTYNVSILNRGLTNASGVRLTNALPAGATFISAIPSQGSCSHSAGVVTCSLGGINAGALATVAITVQLSAPGTAVNVATAFAAEPEAVPLNNTHSETTCVPSPAELAVSVTRIPGCLLISAVPCAPPGCVLEGKSSLSPGGVWSPVAATLIEQGGGQTYVVPLPSVDAPPQRFFRLRCP